MHLPNVSIITADTFQLEKSTERQSLIADLHAGDITQLHLHSTLSTLHQIVDIYVDF